MDIALSDVDKRWTDLIFKTANGSTLEYKELKATEANEFFNIIRANTKKTNG